MPIRIQRTRQKPLPPKTRYIGRAKGNYGKYGNPYTIADFGLDDCLHLYEVYLDDILRRDSHFLDDLRDYDYIACWCATDKKCHGDILLRKMKTLGLIA